jgi:cytochrome oxidase assembly protein ShyY1
VQVKALACEIPAVHGLPLSRFSCADIARQAQHYLDINRLAVAFDLELAPSLPLLDAEDATGFGERLWKPAVMLPAQHRAYAVRWFALAAAALIAWLALGCRRRTPPSAEARRSDRDRNGVGA